MSKISKMSKNIRKPRFKVGDRVRIKAIFDNNVAEDYNKIGIVIEVIKRNIKDYGKPDKGIGNFNFKLKGESSPLSFENFAVIFLEPPEKLKCPKYLKLQ